VKKLLVFILLMSAWVRVSAQEKIDLSFTDSTVTIGITGETVITGFSPDNHHEFKLPFTNAGNFYQAALPNFQRGMSAGKLGTAIIYHLPAGVVPEKLSEPLRIKVRIPKGKVLLWGCEIWTGELAEASFADYFQAREYPIILVDADKYLVRISRFNRIDSLSVAYIWADSTTQAALPLAFQAVDTAALNFGYFAPTYLDKNVLSYGLAGQKKYMLTYFITSLPVMTGAEHYNQPLAVTPPRYIREDGIFHTFFHSLVGKSIIPKEYLRSDGRYCPSDALAMYEGLTTYFSNKYIHGNFAASLSAMLYRACLRPDLIDLRKISLDTENESYYAKAYLFWVFMEANGLNVELFTKWLFSIYLINKPFPVQFDWADVINWISAYDQRLGQLAAASSSGAYLDIAFKILEEKGWAPIPLKDMPEWYDFYIGPYSVEPGGRQLPTDEYPSINSAHPVYLLENGQKLKIEADKSNPALRRIKDNPDLSFRIEFSDGRIIEVKDQLMLGSRNYFMTGTIDFSRAPDFWSNLFKYLVVPAPTK